MIISVFNQKGGVAKTTTSTNLASGLAEKGKKVMLVDFDAQANATNALGVDDEGLEFTIYSLLQEYIQNKKKFSKENISKAIVKTDFNVDLLPTDIMLAEAEQTLSGAVSREMILNKVLSVVKSDYDYIIIDCPPSLGLLSINALSASDYIIIPVNPAYFTIKGLKQLISTLNLIKENIKPELDIMGILITRYEQIISKHKEIKSNLEEMEVFKGKVFKTVIRKNQELDKAQDEQKPINFYNRECNGHEDYINLVEEVINYGK